MSFTGYQPLALMGVTLFSFLVWPFPLHADGGERSAWTLPTAMQQDRPGGRALGALPLAGIAPAAASYLAERAGDVGVAIAPVGQADMYGWRSGDLFPLASVAKLGIMVTVLDDSIAQGEQLGPQRMALLEAMIERSDNDAASALWTSLGGGVPVRGYLRSIGLRDFVPGAGNHWGDSVDSPADVARLLAHLAESSILDQPDSSLALVLMSRIDPSQRWGVTAGAPPGTLLAFKNGWLQASDGTWELHSAGIIVPQRADQAYALVILTQGQPSLEYGVQTIERVAQLVYADLGSPQ